MAKAYLRNPEGFCFPLSQKLTTIGREGRDILIQLPTVDIQHAAVEFSESEECYVLIDLNSIHGTYVNDVKVHNAAVRLAPNDVIRFGTKGTPYELYIHNTPMVSCSRVQSLQRPAWSQPTKHVSQHSMYPIPSASTLPHLTSAPFHSGQDSPITITAWTPAATSSNIYGNCGMAGGTAPSASIIGGGNTTSFPQSTIPHPPEILRPTSAGNSRRVSWDRTTSQRPHSNSPPNLQNNGCFISTSRICGPPVGASGILNTSYTVLPSTDSVMNNKDKRVPFLSNEVNGLKPAEIEIQPPEEINSRLEEQVQQEFQSRQAPPSLAFSYGVKANITDHLQHIESPQQDPRTSQPLRPESSPSPSSNGHWKQDLDEKTKQLANLQLELTRVKKDKNITAGLITQMQRDLSNKDISISKLTREVETLKREIWEKDTHVQTMSTKLSKIKEGVKVAEENEAREKELHVLRNKFKLLETKLVQHDDLVKSQHGEIDKLKQLVTKEREDKRKCQADLEKLRSELEDVERAERVVRVDMEQVTKQLERFHSRVLQVAFSLPGSKVPQKEVTDDDLIDILKKMANAQNKVNDQIKAMEENVKQAYHQKEELIKKLKELETQINQSLTRIKENSLRSNPLKQEMELLKSINVKEPFVTLKASFIQLVNTALEWQQGIEESLEKCGINIKVSTDDPGKHLDFLRNKWSLALEENEQLKKRVSKSDENHKSELKSAITALEKEAQDKVKEAIEKAVRQGKEELKKAVEEVQLLEALKQETLLKCEKEKVQELNVTVDKLKQLINGKDKETHEKLEEANKVLTQIEELKISKSQLEEALERTKKDQELQKEQIRADVMSEKSSCEVEISSYKEQIKQHSITICSLEDKLNKMGKVNREYMDRISSLESELHENRTRLPTALPPPPKPKIIVQQPPQDVLAMELLISTLRKEIIQLKQFLQEKDGLIVGLRRDLVGASARLSDISGELSEDKKEELERSRESFGKQQREMMDLREKLAALSKVIDVKKEQIKKLQRDLEKERNKSLTNEKSAKDLTEKIKILEDFVKARQEESDKDTDIREREDSHNSELSSLGAQCRGERHQQVINRQKEALAELRKRIKTNDMSCQPSTSYDPNLQNQLVMLKKELSNIQHSKYSDMNNSASVHQQVNRAHGFGVNPDAEIERNAHKETLDALEASETSFLFLLKKLLSTLEVEGNSGLRSVAHIPRDERDHVVQDRQQVCQQLVQKIELLQERLGRKEHLLQSYEGDLGKMRKAEELVVRKSVEAEQLAQDMLFKNEEAELLRESLNRTKSRLQQEKRLNNAIKQKKTFHLENERAHIGLKSSPHFCPPDLPDDEVTVQKKAQKEIIKRKNYEIKSLKKELLGKGKDLRQAERTLCHLEVGPFDSSMKPDLLEI